MNKLWENIFNHRGKESEGIGTILAQVPLFQDLSQRELNMVKHILYQRDYKRNEIIFTQDDISLGMYVVVKGTVSIAYGPESHELAELREGDFFGELGLLDEAPRSATAIAKEPSALLCFFKPELLDILQRNPRLGNKILFKLAWTIGERLKSTNSRLDEMSPFIRRDHETHQ